MSKFYTDKAPTPVFAVTFVSNRKGIVPEQRDITKDGKTTSLISTTETNPEDFFNEKYPLFSSDTGPKSLRQQDLDFIKKIKNFKADTIFGLPSLNNDPNKISKNGTGVSLNSLRDQLNKFREEKLPNYYNNTNSILKDTTKDSEYLIYSNLQIQKTDDPNDLSQQSNWYLREAEVELTRDWPIQKAKLIVTCKLLDNGSIPPLVEVEKGFVWSRNKDAFVELLPEGRFLSADDEVRIYAGYKNDQCISMNDLDKYPFDFTNLETTGDIPADSAEGKQLTKLQAEKKAIEDALSKIDNLFWDPYFYLTAALTFVSVVAIVKFVLVTAPVSVPASTITTVIASTSNVAGGTTVFIAGAGGTVVGTAVTTVIPATTTVASGTALGSTAIATGGGAITTGTVGYAVSSNEDLKKALQTELAATNNLIQIIQRKAGVKTKSYYADKDKIAPIFWGFIDSVDFISNSYAGVQIIYNLRDRSRILADTKLVTLPFLGTDANNKNTFEGLKHKTIESVYRATNGGIYLDNNYNSASSLAWRSGFEKGETINLYEDKDKKITDTKSALANERLKYTAAIEDPARWVISNAFLSSSDINKAGYNNFDPLFHTWTLQPPLISGSANNTMQIINKSPFEILNYLAMTEIMPVDIFTSHINGHFMFAPRILDTTGLYDEQRGNRLYYFFDCFDKLPEQRSLIKDIRVQTSTIGVYNRFTVLTADFGSSTNASLSGLTSIVDIASANTKNRKVPIKQHVIVDPKIKDNEGNKEGAAQALALTTASTMARDHTMIIFKIIGDSSFYPGEAVRVFNTVLHSKDVFTFNATSTSSAVFLKSLYDEVQKLKATAVQQGTTKKVVDLSAVIDSMRKVAGQPSDDLNNALPMYKVRSITHSLKANGSDAGYTTKILAVADIL